jgi:putative ABC transport system ATP-binding protein
MQLLHNLHQDGRTIVMVTHDPEIAAHTQRTIHLIDGRVELVVENGGGSTAKEEERVRHESH